MNMVGLFYLAPITGMGGPFRFDPLVSVGSPDLLGILWLWISFAATGFLLLERFVCVDSGSGRGSFRGLPGG